MKKMLGAGLVFLVLAVVLVGTVYAGIFSDSWRYKMTVVVETPEGLKTGSAVREVTVKKGLALTPQMLPDIEVKGEAVVVDLGKRGVLFALMRGGMHGQDYGSDILFDAFPEKKKIGKVTLTPQQYPMFARFRDLNDPKTVEIISQINDREMPDGYGGMSKTSEEVFGSGVKLKDVTIEITNDSITSGIEKQLPWLATIYGYISGKNVSMGNKPYEWLDTGDFQKGVR